MGRGSFFEEMEVVALVHSCFSLWSESALSVLLFNTALLNKDDFSSCECCLLVTRLHYLFLLKSFVKSYHAVRTSGFSVIFTKGIVFTIFNEVCDVGMCNIKKSLNLIR